MREKRKAGTHKAATDPYGQQRNKMMAKKQAAYEAVPKPSQDAGGAKPKRKRAPKKSPRGTAPDGHGDVPLPDVSSPESEKNGPPNPKQPCGGDAGPSGKRTGGCGRPSRWGGMLPSSIVADRDA